MNFQSFENYQLATIIMAVRGYRKAKQAKLTMPKEVKFRQERGLDTSMIENDINKANEIIKAIDIELKKRGIER